MAKASVVYPACGGTEIPIVHGYAPMSVGEAADSSDLIKWRWCALLALQKTATYRHPHRVGRPVNRIDEMYCQSDPGRRGTP